PYALTRAAACRDKGWFSTRDCIGYYPEHCAANAWEPADCSLDLIYRGMDAADSLALTPEQRDRARLLAGFDPALKLEAERRYCTDKNYPADVPACAPVKAECESSQSGNGCQILL